MGTHVRVLVGPPAREGAADPDEAIERVIRLLGDYDRRLSRFRPDSELCALNADPRTTVPVSPLLGEAVSVAIAAAQRTDGLVDPTLLGDLERAGYADSWQPRRRADLRAALERLGGTRTCAAPRSPAYWKRVIVDERAGTISRPAGLRIDTGGTGKGHAADLAAALLDDYETWAVDCGGDVRIGGTAGRARVAEVEDPFGDGSTAVIPVANGAVATSGLRSRIWIDADGRPCHHVLDPSSGRPAFTGLVAATALAPTAVEAEALAKAALLAGPGRAPSFLTEHGGLTIDDAGHVRRHGSLNGRVRVRVRVPATKERAA
jgi:thiamine biosynthesis lipoprotein